MSKHINAVKRELAELAKNRNKRTVGIWPEDPHNWYPGSVIDPRSQDKKPFTHSGAWIFIAEELEKKGTFVKPAPLIAPRGKLGYEFLVDTEYGTIYIKVRLAKDRIIGRSFHYSREG